jgi:hypothetical protein
MLGYLLAHLVAPLLRRFVAVALFTATCAFGITIPARLWARYVSPRPDPALVVGLNVATLAVVLGLAAWHRASRSHRGRRR